MSALDPKKEYGPEISHDRISCPRGEGGKDGFKLHGGDLGDYSLVEGREPVAGDTKLPEIFRVATRFGFQKLIKKLQQEYRGHPLLIPTPKRPSAPTNRNPQPSQS